MNPRLFVWKWSRSTRDRFSQRDKNSLFLPSKSRRDTREAPKRAVDRAFFCSIDYDIMLLIA